MAQEEFAEQLKQAIPAFLTGPAYSSVIDELEKYPNTQEYFEKEQSTLQQNAFQGDGWSSIPIRRPTDGEQKNVTAIVISNTCDIDPNNLGRPQRKVVVAPVILLERYADLLRQHKPDEETVQQVLQRIRKQHTSYALYLPATPLTRSERLVLLDDIHSLPLSEFEDRRGALAFRLNYAGFAIFLFKLSVHFTRWLEGNIRLAP